MKIQHYWNHVPQRSINNKQSETIPDQTMDLQTILRRYAQGLPLDDSRTPIYEGEEYTPDFEHMELTDRMEFTRAHGEYLEKATLELQKQAEEKKRNKLKEELKQELEKEYPKKTVPPPDRGAEGGRSNSETDKAAN